MNWQVFLSNIGITGVIMAGVVWLTKQLSVHFINRDLKAYEMELKQKADNYKLSLDKQLEDHKLDLQTIINRRMRLYDKRIEVMAELYKRLALHDEAIYVLTESVKDVVKDFNSEELERINKARDSFNDFQTYFGQNKIFFGEETCKLIDELKGIYMSSYIHHTIKYRFNINDHNLNAENMKKANEMIRKQIPNVLGQIETDFRKLAGVIEDF